MAFGMSGRVALLAAAALCASTALAAAPTGGSAAGCASKAAAEVEECVRQAAAEGYAATERALSDAGFTRTTTMEDGSVYFMRGGGFLSGRGLLVSLRRDGDRVERFAVAR